MRAGVLFVLASIVLLPVHARPCGVTPPEIQELGFTRLSSGEVRVEVRIWSQANLLAPTVHVRGVEETAFKPFGLQVRKTGASNFEYEAIVPVSTDFELWLETFDECGNGPVQLGTPAAPRKVSLKTVPVESVPTKP